MMGSTKKQEQQKTFNRKEKVRTMRKEFLKKAVLCGTLATMALAGGFLLGGKKQADAATRKCYTISSGNTTVYSNTGLTRRYGAIYGSDEVTVHTVTGKYCKVSYPISGGRSKTGYIATGTILRGTTGNSYRSRGRITTYKRPGGGTYGYVATNDTVTVLGTYGNYTQLKYPVTGGYKYAFITTANANAYIYPQQAVNPAPAVQNNPSWSLSGNLLTVNGKSLTEYRVGNKYTTSRYALVNGRYVDMQGWQCCGYARYVLTKLYGCHDKNAAKRFRDVSGVVYSKNMNAAKIKSVVNAAGVGAHLRTYSRQHSMVIIGITGDGFTIADANSDGKYTVRVRTFTWQQYINTYGSRGLLYVKKYVG